jgi:hypothetical protein
MLKKIKEYVKNFIENLGKSNESTFGNKALDCCDLNCKKNSKKR